MNFDKTTILALAFSSVFLLTPTANAQGLLGILGGGDSNSDLISLDSGPAGNDSLVNVGLGGGNGNVADVNLLGGGTGSGVNANVSTGGGGLLGGGGLQVNLGLGPADINLDLLGDGSGDGTGGGGGDNPGTGGPGVFASTGNGGSTSAQCLGEDPTYVLGLFNATQINLAAWARASNVTIVPVQLCPTDRVHVAELINGTGKGVQLQAAVASDALIATSLGRSSYGINRVAAVQRRGSQIFVYVY